MAIKGDISITDLARTFGVSRQAVQKMLKGKEGLRIKKVGAGFLYEIDSLPKEVQERILETRERGAPPALLRTRLRRAQRAGGALYLTHEHHYDVPQLSEG